MIENVLWVAVAFMLASALTPRKKNWRKLLGAAGWVFFAIHWFNQPGHYLEINDYFNVALVITVGILCLMISYTMFREYRHPEILENKSADITSMATSATALGSLFYFPFAQMESLNVWIIGLVTDNVLWTMHLLNIPAELTAWNKIGLNGYQAEIILACTAIESIALFIGLIISVDAPWKKHLKAFLVSVPVIYGLNIIRDVFVIAAYGYQWFGPNSFEIAHHTIGKIGSGIALFAIAYVVMRILPELIELIEGVWLLVTECIQNILKKVVGNN